MKMITYSMHFFLLILPQPFIHSRHGFLNVISTIRHLLDKKNLEDMFELYMKTSDMNVEFVTNYLLENTHLQNMKSCMTR